MSDSTRNDPNLDEQGAPSRGIGGVPGDDVASPGLAEDGTPRTPSGIPGLDQLLGGGMPKGRATLVSGTAGNGKTLAALHFSTAGAEQAGEGAVFISFEEPASQLRRTMASLNIDAGKLEEEGKLAVIEAVPQPSPEEIAAGHDIISNEAELLDGSFDLSGLLARIDSAAKRVNAGRVALDSLAGLAGMFLNADANAHAHTRLRTPLARLINALKARGLTMLITAERDVDEGPLTRYGLEEFVADGVILLRSNKHGERVRRTVEIKKLRSCAHAPGESPLVIQAGRGLEVLPLSQIRLSQQSGIERTSSGVPELDRMTGGGLLRDSVVLISGATGTGKTLISTHFTNGGIKTGDNVLFLAFEESREQLVRNAAAFGIDFPRLQQSGKLKLEAIYPESLSLEGHLLRITQQVEKHKPDRLIIDSLSALERIGPDFAFRQFLIALAAFVKRNRVTTLLTAGGGSFGDETRISQQHISTLTDTIILLRYVDTQGRVERSLTLLKMRGSGHAREHRRYRIGDNGIVLAGPKGDGGRNAAGERMHVTPEGVDVVAMPPAGHGT
ncbi:MAG: circadian clock protein KaiC, partial [Planctomycetota bacterium]